MSQFFCRIMSYDLLTGKSNDINHIFLSWQANGESFMQHVRPLEAAQCPSTLFRVKLSHCSR